jgi:hypothetical protein
VESRDKFSPVVPAVQLLEQQGQATIKAVYKKGGIKNKPRKFHREG